MTINTPVSAVTCGVGTVGTLQSTDHPDAKDSLDAECPAVPSEDRILDFLTFLDQTASNSLACEAQSLRQTHPSVDSTRNANLLSRISTLEVELEDKEHNLKALRELRDREKLQGERLRRQLQLQLQEELTRTTEKYERQSARQQELLCQLQDEKKEMASRYQRLADEMRELGRRFSAKTAELHKQYGKELERQRKAFLSGEKARRDAWERDRAQEIKEITIKGLEPEIQRLLDKHRNEKRCLEEKMKKVANDMKSQLEQELASQKALVARQMEEAFEAERSQHRQEVREMQERFEAEMRREKELLVAKHREEAAKWESEIKNGKKSLQGEITKAREQEQQRCKEVANQFVAEMERLRQSHAAEVRQAEDSAKAKEKELLIKMEAAKAAAVKEAVETAKKEMEAECHKKIKHLLERLSEEQVEAQSRLEGQCNEALAAAQANFEKTKQELANEKDKLEAELKAANEKRLSLEIYISRLETEAELKDKMQKELQTALDEVSGKAQALESERERKNEKLQTEWEINKQKFEEQCQRLETQRQTLDDLSSKLAAANEQIKEMKIKENNRMEKVEIKVRETIKAKDQTIQSLKDELAASNTKVEHLRNLMSRHRLELMKGISSSDYFPADSVESTAASLLPPITKDKTPDLVSNNSNYLTPSSRLKRGTVTERKAATRVHTKLKNAFDTSLSKRETKD